MAHLVHGIIEWVEAHEVIAPLLVGGIYDRPLRREGPEGISTPLAFDPVPPYNPRTSMAVIDAGEIPEARVGALSIASVNVWVRVLDNAQGVDEQTRILGWLASLDQQVLEDPISGEVGMIHIRDRFPGQVDPWVKGGRMAYMRLHVAGLFTGV